MSAESAAAIGAVMRMPAIELTDVAELHSALPGLDGSWHARLAGSRCTLHIPGHSLIEALRHIMCRKKLKLAPRLVDRGLGKSHITGPKLIIVRHRSRQCWLGGSDTLAEHCEE